MTYPTFALQPLVTFDQLDDPPDLPGGTDPFVVGSLANSIPNSFVDGHAYARVAQSPTSDDTPPTPNVNVNQTFVIDVYWNLSGPLIPAFCGNWAVTIFFESMGPDDFDFQLVAPDPGVPFGCAIPPNNNNNARFYHASFTVPATPNGGPVKVDPRRGTPYELNVSIVLLDACKNLPTGIIGSIKLEDIFFFQA